MRGKRVRLAMSFPSSKRYYTIVRRQIPVLDSSRTVQIPKNVVPPLPEKHGSSQGGGRQHSSSHAREGASKTRPKEGGSKQARHIPRREGEREGDTDWLGTLVCTRVVTRIRTGAGG